MHVPPARGWGPLLALPAAVVILAPDHWPRWLFMWVLAVAIFAGCKWLTWRRTPVAGAPWWRHAGYLFGWPGLDAAAFLSTTTLPLEATPTAREWAGAVLKTFFGAGCFWGLGRLVPVELELLRGWVGMVGLIFMLHFGLFHLLSCGWRLAGVDARPLMIAPLVSVSVSEFWGKRWNTAFRDLTHRFLFRPLSEKLGSRWAVVSGFVFSGLVHDAVISVPAQGGYGWPTLFFLIQAAALLIERSRVGRAVGLRRGARGWLFTVLVLLLPAFGLFHPPFVTHIIVPFMRALGAA